MSQKGSFHLLTQRRFLPLFCTQFLGAFNDNLFKNALLIWLAFSFTNNNFNTDTLLNLCAMLFILPFFLFSAIAGQLADKYEKSMLILYIKLAEIMIILLAVIGFYFENVMLLLIALFLLGIQATFFGPIKYSILPQHLSSDEMLTGNGLIEMGTFIAILVGTLSGGLLISMSHHKLLWLTISMLLAALAGFCTSLFIPKAEPADPSLTIRFNLYQQTLAMIRFAIQNKLIFMAMLGISWFWAFGTLFVTQIPTYTKNILNGHEQVVTLLLTLFSIGIGLGSILCDKLSHHQIKLKTVLLGSLGLSLFSFDLSLAHSALPNNTLNAIEFLFYGHNWRIVIDAFFIGIAGGFFVVPLYTLIQTHSLFNTRSRIIAANNILNALFMMTASLFALICLKFIDIPELFLLTAVLNLGFFLYTALRKTLLQNLIDNV